MDTLFYNPARHLHNLLTAFLDPNSDTKADAQWRSVLEISERAKADVVIDAYAHIVRLPARTRELVNRMPKDEPVDGYLSSLAKIEQAFSNYHLKLSVKQYASLIGRDVLIHLDYTANAIDRLYDVRDHAPNEGQLDALRQQIEGLLDQVTNATDVDPGVRSFMLRHLEEISRGLRLYKVVGVSALVDALDQFSGHAHRDRDTAEGVSKSQFSKGFATVIVNTSHFINVATRLPELMESIQQVLPG